MDRGLQGYKQRSPHSGSEGLDRVTIMSGMGWSHFSSLSIVRLSHIQSRVRSNV